MAGDHVDVSRHIRLYVAVFVALAVFTILTVLAARVHVSMGVHIGIALAIAAIKATLVAAIFMHLKWESRPAIWWVLGLCAVFFVVLITLPTMTAGDHPPQTVHHMWSPAEVDDAAPAGDSH